jgi:hypothetical protein
MFRRLMSRFKVSQPLRQRSGRWAKRGEAQRGEERTQRAGCEPERGMRFAESYSKSPIDKRAWLNVVYKEHSL